MPQIIDLTAAAPTTAVPAASLKAKTKSKAAPAAKKAKTEKPPAVIMYKPVQIECRSTGIKFEFYPEDVGAFRTKAKAVDICEDNAEALPAYNPTDNIASASIEFPHFKEFVETHNVEVFAVQRSPVEIGRSWYLGTMMCVW